MSDSNTAHDSLEAYVLGALDPGERHLFGEHLATCAPCRSERDAYASTLATLGSTHIPAPPPPPSLVTRARRFSAMESRTLLATAAAAVLVVGIAAPSVVRFERSERAYAAIADMLANDPRLVALVGRDARASGRAIVGDGRRRSGFIASGLPDAPAGMVYRVWIRGATGRQSPGALERTSEGLQVLVTPGDALAHASSVRVMLERERNPESAPRREILEGEIG